MKKLIPLFLLIILTLTGCLPSFYGEVNNTPDPNLPAPASAEELYSLYDKTERGMTKDELTVLFGEPTPSTDENGEVLFYKYFNETKSAGVSVVFNDQDVIISKALFYNTKKNLIPFSGRYDIEKLKNVKEDMTIEAAVAEMGSLPLEVSCIYGKDGPESADNIYFWCNEDGSIFKVETSNGTINNCARFE